MKKPLLAITIIAAAITLGTTLVTCSSNKQPATIETQDAVLILPTPLYDGETSVEQALLERRSIRSYTSDPLTLAEVSQLLWAAQEITNDRGGRTAPSAGALYPLEIYLLAGEVTDLSDGIYHYQTEEHILSLVIEGDGRQALYEAALSQDPVKDASAVIIITAMYERTTVKYGDRGIEYVHMEVGSAAQNIYLQALSLDLGTVFIGAFHDEQIKYILHLSGDETPLGIMPVEGSNPPLMRATRITLFLISAATLTFEITLTRLFSVAQFYHFAFMIVSIALLGFGASGTVLTIFPKFGRNDPRRALGLLGLGTGLSILGAYLLTNQLPFDSFSIAWDRRQVWILVLHYVALATPFFFSGMAVGLLLDVYPKSAGETYAVNLFGSALGCVFAMLAPPFMGAEGTVTLASGLAVLGALVSLRNEDNPKRGLEVPAVLLLLFICLDLGLRTAGRPGLSVMNLHLSPYKGYSYAMQYPGAELVYRRWNAFSRVDVVHSAGIHSIPGLSYRYLEPLPGQDGIFVDGDNLSALLPEGAGMSFSSYLPLALPFELRPEACVLVLKPRGGLDVLTALALGVKKVTAVESNPLIVEAAGHVYNHPNVEVAPEADRTYLRRESEQIFDVIILSLTNSYHPVRSGAYSLGEDYRYTVEAFLDALARLNPNGLLSVTRWLQDPPSEGLRTFALAVTALEGSGGNPETQIVAFRGYNTITILIKNSNYAQSELNAIRAFASERAFDLVYAPDIRLEETNRYNILPEPAYYQAFSEFLHTKPRQEFYDTYPFDVRPPTDDHPFFGHYFKWSQAEQIMAELGHIWQPFGGAGYFVILALLALAIFLASLIILLPLAIRRPSEITNLPQRFSIVRPLLYFGFIGLAFLLVEIPLLQRFILYLGNPAYALTAVLFSILLFSGIGSQLSHRISHRLALIILVFLVLITPYGLPHIFSLTLGLPLFYRILLTTLILAPIGFLMGIPFPAGIQWIQTLSANKQVIGEYSQIPWAWATNGAASVVASVLAALLALTFGFNWVLKLGALCYAGALLTVLAHPGSLHR